MGMASPVSEILLFLLALKNGQISLSDHGLPWGPKNRIASKKSCKQSWHEMHGNQFWWAWPLWFQRHHSFFFAFKNSQNFPSDHELYSPWDQKIESAQKIYASRGVCEMHGNKFW